MLKQLSKVKYLLVLVFFCNTFIKTSAQTIPQDSSMWVEKYENTLLQSKENIPSTYEKDIFKIYEDRTNGIIHNMREERFLFDTLIHNYLNNILKEITSNNPSLQKFDINLLPYRSGIPNATCLGNGTIYFNLGLLRYLENESQIAFVVCHELAHLELDHVNKNITKHIEWLYSKEAKEEVKAIKKSGSKSYLKLKEWLNKTQINTTRHVRTNEKEADALGFEFLSNTNYNLEEGVAALEILDLVDKEKYADNFNLKQSLNFEDYPFQDKWLRKEVLLFGSSKVRQDYHEIDDSLKTHPDIEKRVHASKEQLNALQPNNSQTFIQSELNFKQLSKFSELDIVSYYFDKEQYGVCLFYAIAMLPAYKDDSDLNAIIGISFSELSKAREAYKFNDYVALTADENEENYNTMLTFLNNLKIEELEQIAYHFLETNRDQHIENEQFLYGLILINDIVGKPGEENLLKKLYNEKYKEGKYTSKIKQL